jgi:UDPglucose 6-dehydrogenase/GDP-mannose 6-dehydrogenase
VHEHDGVAGRGQRWLGLLSQGVKIKAYDPVAGEEARKIFGNGQITYYEELPTAIEAVDAIVLLTRWADFQQLPALLTGQATQPLVIDGRRMLDKHSVVRYDGIGL